MAGSSRYLLGADEAERQRLLVQGEIHRAEAEWLLDQCGPGPGGCAVDVGCGPLGVLDLLCERVGPAGRVVGLDRDERMLAMAAASVAERGLGNVALARGDATSSGLERGSFDLAHARLLLVNVPDPQGVLREMAALVRPGGAVAAQEVDWVSWVCEPPHPAWDRLREAVAAVWRANGCDVYLGRRLPALLRRAGLVEVGVRANARVFRRGDAYQTLLLSFVERVRGPLLERGLLREPEIDELAAELGAHLDDEETIVLYKIFVQAWGRVGPSVHARGG
ncbi:MAG TPA: methyltransferase domain-containing protein [Polyangiaceae bacterium]|nr:methyltransferase domain-containing protein [Polyangiaceae bacterium]